MKHKRKAIIERPPNLRLATIGLATFACLAISGYAQVESDLSRLLGKSTFLNHFDSNKSINIILVLQLKDAIGAENYAEEVSSPLDPSYQHYLTPEEFGRRFGPDDDAYNAVLGWARNNGLQTNELSRSRTTLSLRGKVVQFESLLGISINSYRGPDGRIFYSAAGAPNLPPEFSKYVKEIVGLSSYTKSAPLVRASKIGLDTNSGQGTGPGGAFNAADLRTAYQIPRKLDSSYTETVALFEQGGFFPVDVEKYEKENSLPAVPVKFRSVNGFGGGVVNDPNIELEAVLDIDMAIGMNPKLKQVVVYEDGDDLFNVALLDALVAIANDNTAQTVSISYGQDETLTGSAQMDAEKTLFQQLAAQGLTVFVSAGDFGAYGDSGQGLNVEDPGSQPSVISVGGTALYTNSDQKYSLEEVWDLLGTTGDATGGGVSSHWKIPHYQLTANGSSVATTNGGSAIRRNVPDVAAVASTATGVAVYSSFYGGWVEVGGTSVSAPVWAGYCSILDAASRSLGRGGIGSFNPLLYSMAESQPTLFNDILDGTNGDPNLYGGVAGYYAGRGYDNCTGWGSMSGEYLALDTLTTPLTRGTPPPFPRGLNYIATSTTVKLHWTLVPNATGYVIFAETTPNFVAPTDVEIYTAKSGSLKLQGLTSKTDYTFFVLAVNQHGSAYNYVELQTP